MTYHDLIVAVLGEYTVLRIAPLRTNMLGARDLRDRNPLTGELLDQTVEDETFKVWLHSEVVEYPMTPYEIHIKCSDNEYVITSRNMENEELLHFEIPELKEMNRKGPGFTPMVMKLKRMFFSKVEYKMRPTKPSKKEKMYVKD